MSRHELVRRAVTLFFEELIEDEPDQERKREFLLTRPAFLWENRDQCCRSTALPPPGRFPLPPGCGEPGE
jgi:hypothetical protein